MAALHITDTENIRFVTVSRPESMNALNQDVIDQLYKSMEEVQENSGIRAVILTGQGDKAFVAGADIKELSALQKQQAYDLSRKGQALFKMIENSTKPVVAAVNGFALGGGCELAMACHIRLATPNARFGQPEINLGIIPGYGGTQRLAQLVGRAKAFELLLTGDMISAEEALAAGLVNRVYASREDMIEAATAMVRKIISKSPIAIAGIIGSVNAGYSFEDKGYEQEAENFAHCADTNDFKEGTAAFLEKRKPVFKGE